MHADHIDKIITAELPNEQVDHDLSNIVKMQMIHGPCGVFNSKAQCMVDGKCSKNTLIFFKTKLNADQKDIQSKKRKSYKYGYIHYYNRWVVPYNKLLCNIFKAHINVENCNSRNSIKYVCKYINKGSDLTMSAIRNTITDEVTEYQLSRLLEPMRPFGKYLISLFTIVFLQYSNLKSSSRNGTDFRMIYAWSTICLLF